MTKAEAKKIIKEEGMHGALYEFKELKGEECDNLIEIMERVLDEINPLLLKRAISKGTR